MKILAWKKFERKLPVTGTVSSIENRRRSKTERACRFAKSLCRSRFRSATRYHQANGRSNPRNVETRARGNPGIETAAPSAHEHGQSERTLPPFEARKNGTHGIPRIKPSLFRPYAMIAYEYAKHPPPPIIPYVILITTSSVALISRMVCMQNSKRIADLVGPTVSDHVKT
jgi:hypothetical protein